jgi:hypothetical protein
MRAAAQEGTVQAVKDLSPERLRSRRLGAELVFQDLQVTEPWKVLESSAETRRSKGGAAINSVITGNGAAAAITDNGLPPRPDLKFCPDNCSNVLRKDFGFGNFTFLMAEVASAVSRLRRSLARMLHWAECYAVSALSRALEGAPSDSPRLEVFCAAMRGPLRKPVLRFYAKVEADCWRHSFLPPFSSLF